MKTLDQAECPDCGTTASGKVDVKAIFGYRLYQGNTYVQSYCKDCRIRNQRGTRIHSR